MLCFIIHQCVLQARVVTSCLFFCMLALTQGEWDCPFRCAHHTLFACLICCLQCVVPSYLARVACSQEWQNGKRVAQTLSTCHLHAGVLHPNQLRCLLMANAVSICNMHVLHKAVKTIWNIPLLSQTDSVCHLSQLQSHLCGIRADTNIPNNLGAW